MSQGLYVFSPQGERVIEEKIYTPLVTCQGKTIEVELDPLQYLKAPRPISLRTLIIFTNGASEQSLCEQQKESSFADSLKEEYYCGNAIHLTPSPLIELEEQVDKVPTLRRQIDRLAYLATQDPLQSYIIVRKSFSLLPKGIDPYIPLSDRLMEIPNICM